MSHQSIVTSIYRTLAYFDVVSWPLTAEELFVYAWQRPEVSRLEFDRVVGQLVGVSLQTKSGYYFLPGRSELVDARRESVVVSEQKIKKALRAARFIRSVPFLRAILLCNSVGSESAKEGSDIDFFIIAERRRIWIVRFFTNLILRLLGLRTYGKHEKDRICLSFYVDTAHLDLAMLRTSPDDIHFAYWITQMFPIYDPENYYEKLLRTNTWVRKLIPGWFENGPLVTSVVSSKSLSPSKLGTLWRKMWEAMWQGTYGDMIEAQAREIQKLKFSLAIKNKAEQNDKGVVISDGVLKFHEADTRAAIREVWLNKIAQT